VRWANLGSGARWTIPAPEMERMMKLQDVILNAMAKKIS
jgi:hypothetical protein